MTGIPARVYLVRGDRVCVSRGSASLIFTVEEFRDIADHGIALCDTVERRSAFPRANHLDDPELSGCSRRPGSSSDDGGQS